MSSSHSALQNLVTGMIVVCMAIGCADSPDTHEDAGTGQDSLPAGISYRIKPLGSSQAFHDARLESVTYKDGIFTLKTGGTAFVPGEITPGSDMDGCAQSPIGQHFKLVVDNFPAQASGDLQFEHAIPDGEHDILAILSRSNHESVKTRDAAIALRAKIISGSMTEAVPLTSPMLFYLQPSGFYEGEDTERILLDYFLVNPDPSHRVKATINEEEFILPSWQAYVIEGLPAGENRITLTLIDSTGQRVHTDLNPVTRKVVLTPDLPED